MQRWRERLSEAPNKIDDRHVDDCYASFVCCWHLKDWLKADPSVSLAIRNNVERFVNGNLWLRLCADLANGSKHLKLKDARFDTPARIEKILVLDLFGLPLLGVKGALTIPLSEDTHSVPYVVQRCMSVWDSYLAEHGLQSAGTSMSEERLPDTVDPRGPKGK
jgi:hypothetical protein